MDESGTEMTRDQMARLNTRWLGTQTIHELGLGAVCILHSYIPGCVLDSHALVDGIVVIYYDRARDSTIGTEYSPATTLPHPRVGWLNEQPRSGIGVDRRHSCLAEGDSGGVFVME
jgi:hypothetical protein